LSKFHDRVVQTYRANTDVPAGDIGVGGREVGFMFGQYKRLRNEFTGILTGRDFFGVHKTRSRIGNVYFAQSMLETKGIVCR
jgi:glutamate dehydrogenase (NADP+)